MRFAFNDDELAMRDAVRAVLHDACPTSVVRAAWTALPGKLDRGLWTRLTELGVPALLLAEDAGGLGVDERSIVLVLEEIGYAGVALPVVESALLAPTLVNGEPGTMWATDLGGTHVPWGTDADRLLLRAPDGSVHDVARDDVEVEPLDATDGGRRLAEVRWTPRAATQACAEAALLDRAGDRAMFGTAAVLVGVLQRLVDMTVAHVVDRHQFGAPIGSFQAVKHHLADAHMRLAFARPAVHRAAWSLATGDPATARHVALAKLLADQAAHVVTRHTLQCHGAIGYTVEYDLHLFLKRAWALSVEWGSEAELHRRLAVELGLTANVAH